MMDLVIKNGIIATESDVFKGDIGIKDGKISAITSYEILSGNREINAEGLIVMPGAIDAHTHFELPIMDSSTADDFLSGSMACCAGGVTTFIDFVTQVKGHSLFEDFEERKAIADGKVYIDYSLHMGITDFTNESFNSIKRVIDMGIPSFKIFMAYAKEGWMASDGDLIRVLEETKKHGGLMGIHGENQSIIDSETSRLVKEGKLSANWHARSRPHHSEVEALKRAIYLTELTQSKLYIFHLTTGEGARLTAEAKGRGVSVYAETCPHYLLLDETMYSKNEGWLYPSCPPLRNRFDSEVLWKALDLGVLSAVATDHCSFTRAQKELHKDNFTLIPRGLPGCETLLPLLYSEGVKKGKISLSKMVDILSCSPAKIFGLYPEKGSLSIGTDADITVFDPQKNITITPEQLHMNADFSPYEGLEITGWPRFTISRGEIIYDNGKFTGEKGRGKFLKRKIV